MTPLWSLFGYIGGVCDKKKNVVSTPKMIYIEMGLINRINFWSVDLPALSAFGQNVGEINGCNLLKNLGILLRYGVPENAERVLRIVPPGVNARHGRCRLNTSG